MNANEFQPYLKKSIPVLKKLAEKHFNAFIRARDKDKCCISCDRQVTEAGHYFSAGHYSSLRFDETNVHGQETRCNRFLSGNLINYRQGLVKRYGEQYVLNLEQKAAIAKRTPYKWDKHTLIEIILRYKRLNEV